MAGACSLGPRFIHHGQLRAADLQNRSALRSIVMARAIWRGKLAATTARSRYARAKLHVEGTGDRSLVTLVFARVGAGTVAPGRSLTLSAFNTRGLFAATLRGSQTSKTRCLWNVELRAIIRHECCSCWTVCRLGTRFGDKIASLLACRVKSRTFGGGGKVAPGGGKARWKEKN